MFGDSTSLESGRNLTPEVRLSASVDFSIPQSLAFDSVIRRAG